MGIYLSPLEHITRFIIAIKNYMESGFLDLLATGQCAEDTYKPATLHFNPAISAYITGTDTPLQGSVTIDTDNTGLDEYPLTGQVLVDGSESKAVGCSSKLATVNPCGTAYTAGGYCDPAKILMKKKCQANIPASIYSGKLRLFVQAIYGSTRDDYTCEWDVVPFDRNLLVGGFRLSHSIDAFKGNHFLLTTSNHDYFVGRIHGNSLKFYPLVMTDSGEQMRDILLSSGRLGDRDFVRRVEAYMLAYATIGPESHAITATGDVPDGVPIAYGWHWTWDGKTGDIVLHAVNASTRQYTARHYRLQITEAFSAGVYTFSAAITTVSTGIWWPVEGFKMAFRPNYVLNDTDWLPTSIGTPKRGREAGTYSAPLYVFYDIDDDIQVYSTFYTLVSQSSRYNVPSGGAAELMGEEDIFEDYIDPISGSMSWGRATLRLNGADMLSVDLRVGEAYKKTARTPSGDRFHVGWYAPATWYGNATNYSNFWRSPVTFLLPEDWMVANGYWISAYQSASFGTIPDRGDGNPATIFAVCKFYRQDYRWKVETIGNLNYDGSQFVEVLDGDCDGLLFGSASSRYASNYKLEESPVGVPAWGVHSFDVVKFYDSVVPGVGTVRVYLDTLQSDVRGRFYLPVGGGGLSTIINRTTPNTDYTTDVRYSRDLAAAQPAIISNTSSTGNWHFKKLPADGPLGSFESARSGIAEHAYQYDLIWAGTLSRSVNYPGDSAVGWA